NSLVHQRTGDWYLQPRCRLTHLQKLCGNTIQMLSFLKRVQDGIGNQKEQKDNMHDI
ncbi:hypothetical protein BS47DRAFT_1343249, partial [Hydnum rufescens UP504]